MPQVLSQSVVEFEEGGEEVRSAMEWAQVRALAADGVSQREIAARLGINRRTVAAVGRRRRSRRGIRASATGSMLDPLEPVMRRLLAEWPEIKAPRVTEILRDDYGYAGLGRSGPRRLAELRPTAVRAAQRTGYRPGQVMQVDWAEMPTRPRIAGRERRVYALICTLPFSGASTAHFSFDMTIESFLEGHVRAFAWLGGVPRECVYDNLRSAVARRDGDGVRSPGTRGSCSCAGTTPFTRTACTPETPREKGSVEGAVRHHKTGFWPARRFGSLRRARRGLRRTGATGSRCRAGTPPAGTSSPSAWRIEREALRALPPVAFDAAGRRASRVPLDGYLKHAAASTAPRRALVHQRVELRWDRDRVWIEHRGAARRGLRAQLRARASGSPRRGCAPSRRRSRRWSRSPRPQIVPPALSDYAELCA